MKTNNLMVPAKLFIISNEAMQLYVENYLKLIYCKNNFCNNCITCIQISQKQHARICWISPEKRYSLEDLDIIFKKILFTLEPDTQFFFIIEHAHMLSGVCANALLKVVEEPPAGYHFIFTASTLEGVLPTLRSRCHITFVNSENNSIASTLIPYFTEKSNPNTFLKILQATTLSEIETILFIENLILHYTKKLISQPHKSVFINQILNYLHFHANKGIMQGGSKIFLKDLYLMIHNIKGHQ